MGSRLYSGPIGTLCCGVFFGPVLDPSGTLSLQYEMGTGGPHGRHGHNVKEDPGRCGVSWEVKWKGPNEGERERLKPPKDVP